MVPIEYLMLYNHLKPNLYPKTVMIDYEKPTINALKQNLMKRT